MTGTDDAKWRVRIYPEVTGRTTETSTTVLMKIEQPIALDYSQVKLLRDYIIETMSREMRDHADTVLTESQIVAITGVPHDRLRDMAVMGHVIPHGLADECVPVHMKLWATILFNKMRESNITMFDHGFWDEGVQQYVIDHLKKAK